MEVPTNSKRARDSPSKSSKAKKQTTISNYWLANKNKNVLESSNSNRFSALDTNDDDENDKDPQNKEPKISTNICWRRVNIQPLYEMLNISAKNSYDIKIVSSNQVKIQLKTPEVYSIVVK